MQAGLKQGVSVARVAVAAAAAAMTWAMGAPGDPATEAGRDEPSVERLAWMAGTWWGEEGGVVMEEHWMEPAGGMMPGLHRDVRAGKRTAFEYLRIEEGPEGLIYQASPQGAPATPFLLRTLEPRKAVFENPGHDFPQRILYFLDDEGALHARVETLDGKKGMEWRWLRAR